ncbi:MAG: DUF3568 family protein [Desulfobacca sp.]|uniref:DUF3568 family protein n=1 Tax=Desulfobacca sp. TaxID=2067990 RepID=UPI00404A2485
MRNNRYRGWASVFLCLILVSGCVETALVGLGATGALAGYKWIEGTLIREYPRSLPEMDQAVQNTCRNFRIKISERRVTPTKATIVGVDANGEDVNINLEAKPNNITVVGVRMGGFMGNREASELFHNQLAKELGL